MKRQKRIAVAAERSSAYGRSFIRGVAEVAEQHPEWNLVLVDPKQATARAAVEFDGWICRVADARTAKALARCKGPVVDCLCAVAEPRFATVKTDAEAIGRLAAEHFMRHRLTNFASSVQKQIAAVRIDEAKRLLDTTSLPIKEVAAQSGFSSLEYLSRAFAAATRLSPSAWRERSAK